MRTPESPGAGDGVDLDGSYLDTIKKEKKGSKKQSVSDHNVAMEELR